jgi:hypothetical protein
MTEATMVAPYRIDIPESSLLDLRQRLSRTRWPEAETVEDWNQGVPLDYMREICNYWPRLTTGVQPKTDSTRCPSSGLSLTVSGSTSFTCGRAILVHCRW